MIPLRGKYIRGLVIRGRSKHTQEAYTRYVRDLARYYRRSPELISYEEVTGWLYHLIKERQLSASSVNIAVSAVRFLRSPVPPLNSGCNRRKRYQEASGTKRASESFGRSLAFWRPLLFFAQAAIEPGVCAFVNMSQITARRIAKSHAAQNHWIAERLFDRSGIPVTHLRPTLFAE
jgi:hypothetical protein